MCQPTGSVAPAIGSSSGPQVFLRQSFQVQKKLLFGSFLRCESIVPSRGKEFLSQLDSCGLPRARMPNQHRVEVWKDPLTPEWQPVLAPQVSTQACYKTPAVEDDWRLGVTVVL
jgi:hypothetical protein